MRNYLVVFAASALILAAADVQSPSAGYARSGDGRLIRIAGIAGAFVTSATEHDAVVSAGFSAQIGVLKLPASIRILDASGAVVGESDAADGPAVIGFNAQGDSAIVYHTSSETMALFQSGAWRPVPFAAAVMALSLKDAGHALAVVAGEKFTSSRPRRNAELMEIRLSDGAVESRNSLDVLDGSQVLLWPDASMLFERGDALYYRDKDENEQLIPSISGLSGLAHMGEAWVHMQTRAGRNLALRPGIEPRVYVIPEVAQ